MSRPNILVVCGKNKRRSRTAEFIFKNDSRFNIRSAGLSPKSDRKLTGNDLRWADITLVMETNHRAKIKDMYSEEPSGKIEVLNIPDEYDFMDEELIEILQIKVGQIVNEQFGL